MEPQLVVTEDLPAAAVELFVGIGPRSIALAGGETPRPVYEALAAVDHPWDETDVLFGDERCVPPDHEDSNFRMANEALLSRVPARAHPMPWKTCDPAPYEDVIRQVAGDPPRLDLVFLGLGEDGHTASLFPGDPALEERERLVARVARPDHPRLTLTLPVLSAAGTVIFLVDAPAKRDALEALIAGSDIPAARVTAERVVVLSTPAVSPR